MSDRKLIVVYSLIGIPTIAVLILYLWAVVEGFGWFTPLVAFGMGVLLYCVWVLAGE